MQKVSVNCKFLFSKLFLVQILTNKMKFSSHTSADSIFSSFVSHKLYAVNKLNLFTNKVPSTISKEYIFLIFLLSKERDEKENCGKYVN